MSSATLTLIANPKTRKDWENNQKYYRQKHFSKGQLEKFESDKKRVEMIYTQVIAKHGSGENNALDMGLVLSKGKKNNTKPVIPAASAAEEPVPETNVETTPVVEAAASTLPVILLEEVDDWESL